MARAVRVWLWLGSAALLVAVLLIAGFEIMLSRAEPILRARLTEALSQRFHSRVEMGAFGVSLLRGFEVTGKDLAIFPYNMDSSTPVFSVRRFSFRTGYRSLLRSPIRIGAVRVEGLRIQLPPKSQRRQSPQLDAVLPAHSNVSILVDELHCTDTVLTLATDKPGKLPVRFVIQSVVLHSIGPGRPLNFEAMLTNPKPEGQIKTQGSFGPWNTARPGDTPLGGTYSFQHADLGTFKGIAGILASQGVYQGVLDKIVVDGKTDTPDFQVKISGHTVDLHTDFHAIVDATDGNTYLQPVKAHFLHSSLTAQGYVVREQGEAGRHTYLDIGIDQARIQDLLWLGVRSTPPVLEGRVKLHAKLDLPPGERDAAHRLHLAGNFIVYDAHFSNPKIQNQVDQISLRSQGEVELAQQEARDGRTEKVRSQMSGDFDLTNAALNLPDLHYDIPGARIKLAGVYSLDGARFDFAGTADMQATVSRMVGGWKGILLMPLDKYFSKNGAGTEIPFKIDGTRSDPHFGLDLDRLKAPPRKTPPQKVQ